MKELLIPVNAIDWLDDIQRYQDYMAEVHCTEEDKAIVALLIASAWQKILDMEISEST